MELIEGFGHVDSRQHHLLGYKYPDFYFIYFPELHNNTQRKSSQLYPRISSTASIRLVLAVLAHKPKKTPTKNDWKCFYRDGWQTEKNKQTQI